MNLQLVPARQGAVWVRRGFQAFIRQPFGFASLFAVCLFFVLLLRAGPALLSLALVIVAPAVSLLFMIATRLSTEGRSPMPHAFTELARAGRPSHVGLLKLGIAYLVAATAIYALSAAVDGGAFGTFVESTRDGKSSQEEVVANMVDARLQLGFFLWFTLVGLLAVPFWHAPALVHWGAQGWAKSLFFSTVAVWRNRGAFAMFGLTWAAVGFAFMMLSAVGVGLLGPQLYPVVGAPVMLALATVFYASLWFTFADCFSTAEIAAPETPLETPS